jgi:hypothetical protein
MASHGRNGYPFAMRPQLSAELARGWSRIGQPGTWLTAAERVAVAAETRHALHCPLCAARKSALSPLAVPGAHASLGQLAPAEIEAIHRIRTDSGRIGDTWHHSLALPETRYIELVSIVVVTVAADTFRRAAGLPELPLPSPQPGQPTRRRPAGATPGPGFTHALRPEHVTQEDPNLFRETSELRERRGANIHLALSLVPDSMFHWWDMFEPMYLDGPEMREFGTEVRAISHAQLEMLAARVAALNRCEY